MISDMIVHDAHVTLISDIYDIQMVCLSSLSAEVVQYQPLHNLLSAAHAQDISVWNILLQYMAHHKRFRPAAHAQDENHPAL